MTETSVKFCSEDEEEKEQIGGNNSEKANQSGNDLPQEKSAEVGIDLSTLDPIQPATEVESSVVKSNSNPSLSVNRSLPSWMMESSQDVSKAITIPFIIEVARDIIILLLTFLSINN